MIKELANKSGGASIKIKSDKNYGFFFLNNFLVLFFKKNFFN